MGIETIVHSKDTEGQPQQTNLHADAMRVLDEGGYNQPASGEGGQPQPGQPAAQPESVAGGEPGEGGQPAQAGQEGEAPASAEGGQPKPEGEEPAKSEPPKPEESPLAEHFAELSRREGQLTRRQIEIERREEALKGRETGASDLKEIAREDPLAALDALGLSYQDVTNHILEKGGKEADPHARVSREQQRKIERLESEHEELKQAREREATERAERERESEAQAVLDKNESLELSRAYGKDAVRFALQVAAHTEQTYGTRPPLDKVFEQVEAYYEEQVSRLSQLPKVRSKLPASAPAAEPATDPNAPAADGQQPAAPANPDQPAAAQQPAQPQPGQGDGSAQPQQPAGGRTLNNAMQSNAGAREPRIETDEERRARAMKLLEESEQKS